MTAHDEAVEAAAEAIRRSVWGDIQDTDDWTAEAEAAIAAAAPILLAAERQRIAEAIRARSAAEYAEVTGPNSVARGAAYDVAARIAEAGP